MEAAVAIGADPAVTYAATAPMPSGMDEMLLAGFIRQAPVRMVGASPWTSRSRPRRRSSSKATSTPARSGWKAPSGTTRVSIPWRASTPFST